MFRPNLWSCCENVQYQLLRMSVELHVLSDSCPEPAEDTRRRLDGATGVGSHANWRRAAKPVNLCSEPLCPGVRLGNDISPFLLPSLCLFIPPTLHPSVSESLSVDPGRSQRNTAQSETPPGLCSRQNTVGHLGKMLSPLPPFIQIPLPRRGPRERDWEGG